MRKASAELAKRGEASVRIEPGTRLNPRRAYCRPEILESLTIHRAAELAAAVDCPLRR